MEYGGGGIEGGEGGREVLGRSAAGRGRDSVVHSVWRYG